MILYRIAKKRERANDLSGQGAANEGGRWNSEGIFALYTSESRALAMLELLVHVDDTELPPNLFVMTIEVDDSARFYEISDTELSVDWRLPENLALKKAGDNIFRAQKFIGIKARSAVMPREYNYVLNPLFPRFYDLVKVVAVEDYQRDERL
ncbi:RES family NAD+ phosphorylase [Dyadobacter psychrotolerans]|uniref:RES domain-containing protein n=1 Tax=Dyadobacter psychrotolerans TaxID=2541721 RepID=A0A4R5DWS5_9BACT|nr:RES family NAD+ phosphorylase [Dyadobacter psychrotolerans]TDE18347.1 RES domain-containing protein [Dyadobacter psychrotolerans]